MSIDKEKRAIYAKLYAQKNPEKVREQRRKWKKLNPERVKAYKKKSYELHKEEINKKIKLSMTSEKRETARKRANDWYHNNLERAKETRKKYQEKNYEKLRAYKTEHYLMNLDEYKKRARRWDKSNPEKIKNIRNNVKARRRIRESNAYVENIDRNLIYDRDNGICQICGELVPKNEMTIDHIIPLAKDGIHSYNNVQLAHSVCNSSKGVKTIHEYNEFKKKIIYVGA